MKVAIIIAAFVILALGMWMFGARAGGEGRVDGAKARALVEGGATLLDVRTPQEFSSRALPGAKNIPVQSLDGKLAQVGPKDTPVVVYCQSGMRSAKAAGMLRDAGFTEVYDLGGIGSW